MNNTFDTDPRNPWEAACMNMAADFAEWFWDTIDEWENEHPNATEAELGAFIDSILYS